MNTTSLFDALGYAAITGLLGVGLLILGFMALDWLTPGHLPSQVGRSMNAAVVAAGRIFAVGAIAFTTIWTNADDRFWVGLIWTAVFGVMGILIQSAAVALVQFFQARGADHIVNDNGPLKPGAVLLFAVQIAAAAITIAAIA